MEDRKGMDAVTYSIKQEKKVVIQAYQPNAASLLALLKEHDESTDTDLVEWKVDIERKAIELSNFSAMPGDRWRWEITLTRSIK